MTYSQFEYIKSDNNRVITEIIKFLGTMDNYMEAKNSLSIAFGLNDNFGLELNPVEDPSVHIMCEKFVAVFEFSTKDEYELNESFTNQIVPFDEMFNSILLWFSY